MEWIKKHVDTAIVLGGILSAVLWMNGKFNDVEKEINVLSKDLGIIKAVLIIKGIMPAEVAAKGEK